MSNVFTLDALREATKKQFAPFELTLSDGSVATLVSTLRLGAKDRTAVREALDKLSDLKEDDADDPASLDSMVEAMSKIFNAIADKPAKLLSDLHDEDILIKVALMSKVLSAWIGDTEVGEA